MLGKSHTAYDVMKEYLLTEAELCGKYDFPALYSSVNIPGSRTSEMLSQCYYSRFQHSRRAQRNAYSYATMEQV